MNDLQRRALAYFVSMGWSAPQSAGIVANLWAESQLNPAAVGDGGQAYGIAQWHPPRQQGFSDIIGHDIHGSTLDEQLAYVHAELQRGEKTAGDYLRTCTTASDAGATVSRLYERPADTEGEAARRGALAQAIFEAYSSAPAVEAPAAPPPPEAAPVTPTEAPMGAIATFLPLIMQMVPALFGIKGLGAVVGAPPGAPPVFTPPATGSLHAADYVQLAQVILDTFVKAVPGAQNPAMAVGMAQADPAVAQAASAAVLSHPDVAEQLNAQIPVFDKIAQYDAATNAAQIAGQQAAMVRQAAADPAMLKLVVGNINGQSWLILGGLLISLIAAAVAKSIYPDIPDYFTAVLALIGPLAGQVMKERGAVIAYYFDGTPASNATAAVNQQIAAMNATKQAGN